MSILWAVRNRNRDLWKYIRDKKTMPYKSPFTSAFCVSIFLFDLVINCPLKPPFHLRKPISSFHGRIKHTDCLLSNLIEAVLTRIMWNFSKQFVKVISLVGPTTFHDVTDFLRSPQKEVWATNWFSGSFSFFSICPST